MLEKNNGLGAGHLSELSANKFSAKTSDNSALTHSNRFWIKLIVGVSFIAAAFAIIMLVFSQGPAEVVEEQLKTLRQEHYSDAYYNYTARSFQDLVTLEQFRQFIQQNPSFLTNQSIRFKNEKIQDNVSFLEASLINRQGAEIAVNYRLIKEGDKWKILSMKIDENDLTSSKLTHAKAMMASLRSDIALVERSTNSTTDTFSKIQPPKAPLKIVKEEPILESQDFAKEIEKLQLEKLHIESSSDVEKPSMQQKEVSKKDQVFDPKSIYKVIESQLSLIRQGKIEQSYTLYSSKEFKKATTFKAYSAFLMDHKAFINNQSIDFDMLAVNNNVVIVTGTLTTRNGNSFPFEYNVVSEEGNWKVLHIQLFDGEDEQASAELDYSKADPLVFDRFALGNLIDTEGVVTHPKEVFKPQDGPIHLNLYLKNARVGAMIDVEFQHVDSRSKAPIVNAKVPENGDLILSFTFTPPAKGWPKGNYRIEVASTTGIDGYVDFKVE